jgi:hypothetical protein
MSAKREIWIAIAMFLITWMMATSQNWAARELLWGLWISSLTLGYSFIVISILGMLIRGDGKGLMGNARKGNNPSAVIMNLFLLMILVFILGFTKCIFYYFLLVLLSIAVNLNDEWRQKLGLSFLPNADSFFGRIFIFFPVSIFMLGFFSLHFIGFHFVHGLFLNSFFPLIEENPFGEDFEGTITFFFTIVREALYRFWPFVLISGFSRIGHYVGAFRTSGGGSMILPYKNVVRMHLTIIAMGFLYVAEQHHYTIYLILLFYFLPVGSLFKLLITKKTKEKDLSSKPIE